MAAARRHRGAARKAGVLFPVVAAGWFVYTGSDGRVRLIALAVLAAFFAGVVLWRRDPDAGRWLRGADGELATAAAMERLSSKRWHVFHDLAVPGSWANIDHLAVGRTGVWVIDTKTTRAPVRARFRSVRLGDRCLPTESVRWQAEVVSDRLGLPVRPLIALRFGSTEGRVLPRRGVRSGGVRVVPGDDLLRRLKRGRRRLSRSGVEAVAGEVRAMFRPAAGRDRQNEPGPQKRRHGPSTT